MRLLRLIIFFSSVYSSQAASLKFTVPTLPESLRPARAANEVDLFLMRNINEGLIDLDPLDSEPIPAIAESWKISADKRNYLFFLRPNAKFSSGKRITAEHFVRAFKAIFLNPVHHGLRSIFEEIFPLPLLFQGGEKIDIEAEGLDVAFSALGDSVLKIDLEKPAKDLLYFLSLPTFYPAVPKDRRKHISASHVVSSGPYYISKRDDNKWLLKKSAHYWGARAIRIDEVEVIKEPNPYQVLLQIEKGEIDWTGLVDIKPVVEPRDVKQHKSLGRLMYWLLKPETTVAARWQDNALKAILSLSIDREFLMRYVLTQKRKHRTTFLPAHLDDLKPGISLTDSKTAATNALSKNGFCLQDSKAACKPIPILRIKYDATNDVAKKLAFALKLILTRNLATTVKLLEDGSKDEADFTLVHQSPWFPLATAEAFRLLGWLDKPSQQYVREMQTPKRRGALKRLYRDFELGLLTQFPFIPVCPYLTGSLYRRDAQGFYQNSLDRVRLKDIYKPKS